MLSPIDRILGRRAAVTEATSIIPADAQQLPGTGVSTASDPTSAKPKLDAVADTSGELLPTALALVAPDTTPKASYPLNPALVPAAPMQPRLPGTPSMTPAPGGFLPRSNDGIADPALATIVGESLASMTPVAAVKAASSAAAAMVPGTEMPPPTTVTAEKVCDAFRKFQR